MDLYEAIVSRRSVRSFLDRPVEDDKLQRVLKAFQAAPTGRNLQEYKLVVVRDPSRREDLSRACDQPYVAQAPVVVTLLATNPQRMMACGVPAAPVDGAIALDHLSLAATAEGLGTCWIGHFPQGLCRRLLNAPETAQVIELMLVGYPADQPVPRQRKGLDDLVCHESFE